jgi:hypothetical protein
MKRVINRMWILLVLAAFAVACDREGTSDLYIKKEFVPIKNVQGEGGYGWVQFTLESPDSSSSLLYTELTFTRNNAPQRFVFGRSPGSAGSIDTMWINNLPGNDYSFRFVSYAEDGANVEVAVIPLTVQDWELEPPAPVAGFSCLSAENILLLYWVEPAHATYEGTVFDIYRAGTLVKTETVEKGSAGEIAIQGLDYHTDYELKYYSFSGRGIRSPERVVTFSTGGIAPPVPEITVSTSRIDYAHSAEITWTASPADSLLVRFIDLTNENREYRFGTTRGREYLSLLPGGTAELKVQARGTDGTWSLPQTRVIRTRMTDETYSLRVPNCLDSQDQRLSKLSERFYQALGHGTYDDYKASPESGIYTFQEMAVLQEITLDYEIRQIDELELLVNLQTLRVNANSPGATLCPQVEYFLQLVDRLPRLKEVIMHANYPRYAQLKEELEGNTKVVFRTLE